MRSISERPREAEAHMRLVTFVDRASGLLEGGRAESLTKTAITDVEIAAPSSQPAVETVTPDRGKEFAEFRRGRPSASRCRTTLGRAAPARTPTGCCAGTS